MTDKIRKRQGLSGEFTTLPPFYASSSSMIKAGSSRMAGVELGDGLLRVVEVLQGFPGVVLRGEAFPVYQIPDLASSGWAIELAVDDVHHLPLGAVLQLHWFWGRWNDAVDVVTLPGREFVDMEYGMETREGVGEFEPVVEVADALNHSIRS